MEKITILLAAYNGAQYIDQMIQSIQAQTATNWRLILSDDNSEDGTPEILERYAQEDSGRIVHYRSGQRFGCAQRHFMHLLEKFHDSEYIMFCDQDDVWHADKIFKTMNKMKQIETSGKPAMVHTDLRVVDNRLEMIDPSFMHFSKLRGDRLGLNHLLVQNVVTGCTMMINRPLAELAVVRIPRREILMHDWWLALIAAALGTTGYLNEATIDYRQHENNVVGAKNSRSVSYILNKLKSDGVRTAMQLTYQQARAFCETFADLLTERDRILVTAYASLENAEYFVRRRIFVQYSFYKIGISRIAAQMIWG